jgi:hypothetical protein
METVVMAPAYTDFSLYSHAGGDGRRLCNSRGKKYFRQKVPVR